MQAHRGMTLLELLIALSLFALIAAGSYRMLTVVADTQELTERYADRLGVLRRALAVMQRDMDQVVDRPYRDRSLKLQPAVRFDANYPLILTRSGYGNPLQQARSELLRVAYVVGQHPASADPESPFQGDERTWLLRAYWADIDAEPTLESARVQALLPDVEALQVQAIVDGSPGVWPSKKNNARLTAIVMQFEHPELGAVERLFALP